MTQDEFQQIQESVCDIFVEVAEDMRDELVGSLLLDETRLLGQVSYSGTAKDFSTQLLMRVRNYGGDDLMFRFVRDLARERTGGRKYVALIQLYDRIEGITTPLPPVPQTTARPDNRVRPTEEDRPQRVELASVPSGKPAPRVAPIAIGWGIAGIVAISWAFSAFSPKPTPVEPQENSYVSASSASNGASETPAEPPPMRVVPQADETISPTNSEGKPKGDEELKRVPLRAAASQRKSASNKAKGTPIRLGKVTAVLGITRNEAMNTIYERFRQLVENLPHRSQTTFLKDVPLTEQGVKMYRGAGALWARGVLDDLIVPDGYLRPNEPLKNGEFALILCRIVQGEAGAFSELRPQDARDIRAATAIARAIGDLSEAGLFRNPPPANWADLPMMRAEFNELLDRADEK